MTGRDNKDEYTARETETNHRDLIENARDLIQCVNSEGKFIFVNQAWRTALGYSADEIDNITLWDIIHPDSMEHCMAVFEQVLTGKAFGEVEAIFVAKDGTPVMVEGNVDVKLDENGRFVHTRGIFRNVTGRKQAEMSLRENLDRFNQVTEQSRTFAWEVNLEGLYTYISRAVETVLGYQPEELVGKIHFYDLHPKEGRETFKTAALATFQSKKSFVNLENPAQTRDGLMVWLSTNGMPVFDHNGALHGYRGSDTDITDRKRVEEALKASEEKYREILSAIEEGYYETNLAGKFVFLNDSFCKMSGYSRNELMEANYKKLYKNPQEVFQTFNRVYRTGKPEKAADWPVITRDGKEIFIELSITLRRDDNGSPIGFRGITRDVTERRLAEEKLREYEKLQQLLMDLATECINVPLEKVDEAINEMLEAVGEFTKVDRVYIFKHDYHRRVTSNTHEWCAEGITPEIDNLQEFSFEHFIDFLETNQKGEIVHIPDVAKLPVNHAMRSLFEAQGIQSMIMLPLFSEDLNSGFVGFDAVKHKKTFTGQEINLLTVLAEIASNVLTRQKAETNIRYMSFHDQLTGLYNRYFLEEEMARLNTKRQLPLAVIMADLNGLKLVNDTYGHDRGDKMLKIAANIIRMGR